MPRPHRARLRRLLLLLGVLTGTFLIADVMLTVLFVRDDAFLGRPLPPFATYLSPEQRANVAERLEMIDREGETAGYRPFDAEIGWVNRPTPAREPGTDGFNAIGARSQREYAPAPPPGVIRFVAFGDSFTHCAQVGVQSSWPTQLEALEPTWEVINLGVNGYGTDQALLLFRRQGPPLAPRVVLIGIMLENIMRNVNRYLPALYPGGMPSAKPRFILTAGRLEVVPLPFASGREMLEATQRGEVSTLLADHEYWVDPPLPSLAWRSSAVRLAVAWLRREGRKWRPLWLDPEGEPYRVTLAILETFHREALRAGAERAVVLLFPSRGDLEGFASGGDRYWSGPLRELERRGIPCIDLAQPLAEAWTAAPPGQAPARLYSGLHLSHEGNAIVAQAVREWYWSGGADAPKPR